MVGHHLVTCLRCMVSGLKSFKLVPSSGSFKQSLRWQEGVSEVAAGGTLGLG